MEAETSRLYPEWLASHPGLPRNVFRENNGSLKLKGTRDELKVPRDDRGSAPDEWPSFNEVVHAILSAHRAEDVHAVVRGALQHYIRHDVLIAAWGNFRLGAVHYDLLATERDLSRVNVEAGGVAPILNQLFQAWVAHGHGPLQMNVQEYADAWRRGGLHAGAIPLMARMTSVAVHGLLDQRGHRDCLYAFFSFSQVGNGDQAQALKLLVPYLDTALKQIEIPDSAGVMAQADNLSPAQADDERATPLSRRETEIMDWVALGKTNAEIGNILSLSSFTIKNHMQRIFKKLDVFNRAQAVSVFKSRHGSAS